MRVRKWRKYLICALSGGVVECFASSSSSSHDTEACPSHEQSPQTTGKPRRRQNTSNDLGLSQPEETEIETESARDRESETQILPSSTRRRQSESTNSATTTDDEHSSDRSTASRSTSSRHSSATRRVTTTSSSTSEAAQSTSSVAPKTVTLTKSISSTSSPSLTSSATASASPTSEATPFRMSAGSITAAVVLCCFLVGGLSIMGYFWLRRYLAVRRHSRWNSLTSDSFQRVRPKSFGDSLASTSTIARESMMFHPDDRKRGSAASMDRDEIDQNVTEREPHDHYRNEHTDIPMSEIERLDEIGRSPVSPLIAPLFPRPVSNISRQDQTRSLRREFSYEDTYEPPPTTARESRLSSKSALSSHPPSEWSLAMPTYYGRGFPPQASPGYRSTSAKHLSSGGWHSVGQRESFEEVQTRGG